jgi:hypothetical protein
MYFLSCSGKKVAGGYIQVKPVQFLDAQCKFKATLTAEIIIIIIITFIPRFLTVIQ